ncbi:Sulfatase modifying factor 1 precursor (C-alpha-formyglycine- generating enzyme 1) [hydrothermal vent metagenome]|uniref:Sulfatase modifying factor 1 (C-alpha-formyglycine- generating enzyme 1) n=1 Tax=hydrothermal vent metagenome TaxID=652676 RepID=A0A3B0Y7H2_9ZZZZ
MTYKNNTLPWRHSLYVLLLFSPLSHSAERISVPAGSFQMGCSTQDADCEKDEGPKGGVVVTVPTFSIDKYEVSVKEYTACVKAGKCIKPKDFTLNNYCNYGGKGREKHPVNCIDWSQAVTYCKTQGGRLPYEAEWEKAARAGTSTRYPWGDTVSCKNAILDDGKTKGSVANEHDGCGEDRTWPRATRKANQYGLFDMHGNAGEWIYNWYAKKAISKLYASGNLAGPIQGKQKLVRGGSWDENRKNLRSSFRNVKPPESGSAIYGSIGFRCAYSQKK